MPESRSTPDLHPPEPVAALIMAAGGASRMGISKALLDWRGESLVRRAARAAIESHCAEVFVVVGANGDRVAGELRELAVEVISHPGWAAGMGSSIAAGVAQLEARSNANALQGMMLLLCDQPFIEAKHIDQICALQQETNMPMVACRRDETLGPPAYFDRSLFARLRSLAGDRGAKSLLLAEPDDVATLACPAAWIDLDTPEDYQRALAMTSSELE